MLNVIRLHVRKAAIAENTVARGHMALQCSLAQKVRVAMTNLDGLTMRLYVLIGDRRCWGDVQSPEMVQMEPDDFNK